MNLVGKIFVSLIAIMSIIFFSLTLVLYAHHKNWKADSESNRRGSPRTIKKIDSDRSKQDLENITKGEAWGDDRRSRRGSRFKQRPCVDGTRRRTKRPSSALCHRRQQCVKVTKTQDDDRRLGSARTQRAGYLQACPQRSSSMNSLRFRASGTEKL